MMNLYIVTAFFIAILPSAVFANEITLGDMLIEGSYINTSDNNRSCVVSIKQHKTLLSNHKYVIEVISKDPLLSVDDSDYTTSHKESIPFSIKAFKEQVNTASNGEFSFSAKTDLITTSKLFGKIFTADGGVYLDVSVSSQGCVGFCTYSVSSCTVRLK